MFSEDWRGPAECVLVLHMQSGVIAADEDCRGREPVLRSKMCTALSVPENVDVLFLISNAGDTSPEAAF
jgi:hypothetical protein